MKPFQLGYAAACDYFAAHGDLLVPMNFLMPDGYNLGLWVQLKRRQYKSGRLTQNQIRDLEAVGIAWSLRKRRSK